MTIHPLPAALIFDCDGTLVLTGELHFAAFSAALAAQGSRLDRDFYEARTGLDRTALIEAWAAQSGHPVETPRAVRDSMIEAEAIAIKGFCRPNDPVAALARAWGRRPSAVASNGEGPVVMATLRACGLDGLFDTVVTREQVEAGKPDPALFLLAANRLQAPAGDCLVLEDSDQGVEAARACGMRFIDVRMPSAAMQMEGIRNRLTTSEG